MAVRGHAAAACWHWGWRRAGGARPTATANPWPGCAHSWPKTRRSWPATPHHEHSPNRSPRPLTPAAHSCAWSTAGHRSPAGWNRTARRPPHRRHWAVRVRSALPLLGGLRAHPGTAVVLGGAGAGLAAVWPAAPARGQRHAPRPWTWPSHSYAATRDLPGCGWASPVWRMWWWNPFGHRPTVSLNRFIPRKESPCCTPLPSFCSSSGCWAWSPPPHWAVFIHILLVVAIVIVLLRVIQGRSPL